jgi:hypothetical protein
MNQEELDRKFENLWRIYGNSERMNQNKAVMSFDEFFEYIKDLCRKFFTGGVAVGESFNISEATFADDSKGICITTKHDPILDTADEGFEEWWNLYNNKRGKEKCKKKWAKLSLKDKRACLDATPAYVASTPDVTYRKDPYTYLYNSSWNDEIYFRNGTDKPTIEQQRINKLASILTE